MGIYSVTQGRGGSSLKGLNFFRNPHIWGFLHHNSAFSDDKTVFNSILRLFWPGFGNNKYILYIFQCQDDMRSLRKHGNMFSEISHHGKFPFWAKTYLIWGGRGGVRLTGLKKFAYPGQFLQSRFPLETAFILGFK